MGITAYDERDYTFGQIMLNLRINIGLTQAGLANELGISRRAVGEWEAGSSYPKVQHLKALIALAIQQRAFTLGQEAEEIRALWKSARQRVFLDELWLTTLLSPQCPPHPHLAPNPPTATVGADTSTTSEVPVLPAISTNSNLHVDWGDALALSTFYGRTEEQTLLLQWLMHERSRMIGVLGMGGIGKSGLVVNVMHHLALGTSCPFEVVIFRSLRDAPALEVLLDDCLQVLSPQLLSSELDTPEQRFDLLMEHLRKIRVLVVLDNMEGLLEEGDTRGHFRPGFEAYEQLLHWVSERGHQSCLLFTSREKPAELKLLEGKYPQVRSLRLAGLDVAACKQILEEKEMRGTTSEQERLIEAYSGNPLALKIVGETIVDLFGGAIGPFLAGSVQVFGTITDLLEEQFVRLSALEQSILCWLAIARESMTLNELQGVLVSPHPHPRVQVLDAVESLRRRSLIERGQRAGSLTLQSVVLEYVTALLVAEGSREIQLHQLKRLIQHGLELAHCKEYVRQAQVRLLLSPLLADLQRVYWKQTDVEGQFLALLDDLRKLSDFAQGYGPANLIALLRLQRGHLSGLDLSHLSIRGAYLQSVEMHDTSLVFALIRDTLLTEAVNATWVVAISPDGRWWVAGSMHGLVRVWEEESQTLYRIWQAHAYAVYSLAFSPDGRTFASGSTDGTIKLWDVETIRRSRLHETSPRGGAGPHDALLWTGWQKSAESLAFTPDGSLLASAGTDATVQLWDSQNGTSLQTLTHASQVRAVAFSPDGHLLASGSFDGMMRLWQRTETPSSPYVEILSIQTSWIMSLVFSPDGRTLASTHQDQTVRLWEVRSFRFLQTLSGVQAKRLAWSPDGRILACSGSDKRIWLWDVQTNRIRLVLHGHSGDVYSIAFAPDSTRLLSGSADGTLRVWNVESGQCVRVIAGYGVTFLDLDWSPDGTHLVSGGTDTLVTIWDASGETLPRVLRGHTWLPFGVGWSPDGRFVASCGWDQTLCLWDTNAHTLVQRFVAPSIGLFCVAWSPDGSRLACGTHRRGMRMWDVRTGTFRWVGLPDLTVFYRVAWSPDGRQIAGCSDDGCVYVWESANGTLQMQLSGHGNWVNCVAWSPDGTRLASGSSGEGSGELFMWDVESRERLRAFAGHSGQVHGVVWSPSGDQLISGDTDGKLRWWDVLTGACLSMRQAHRGAIRSLRMSPDGKRLASCGDDGAIRIWNLDSGELLRTLRHPRPYERLNITGIRGLNEAQKASLQALGAIEESAPSPLA